MRRAVFALMLLSAPAGAMARPSVLVELFTAQGCATCAQANASMIKLMDRSGVAVLTWSVDYWDYLGWQDTFAQPGFAERQRLYDTRFGLRDVYTPQVVIDGAAQASGDKPAVIETLIRQARRAARPAPDIEAAPGGRIAIGSGRAPRSGVSVWLVRYDPTQRDIEVKAGDNHGATVSERNVVRQLARLGAWSGRPRVFSAPAAPEDGLRALVIVQADKGGPVIGFGEVKE